MTSLSRLAMYHGALDALPLLRAMINDEFKNEIALITSFGADAALLLSMVAEVNAQTPVLFLQGLPPTVAPWAFTSFAG